MQGFLRKMTASYQNPIDYHLVLNEKKYALNAWIGKVIYLNFTGKKACVYCHRLIKKTFNQGYCFPCFKRLAQCDLCILQPYRCHFDQGTCRDESFAKTYCMQSHCVYLAYTSGVKVGITRCENLPTRWIDQGATQALAIYEVSNRHQSGFLEKLISAFISDRTNWQRMLKNQTEALDLKQVLQDYQPQIDKALESFYMKFDQHALKKPLWQGKSFCFHYPVQDYPKTIKALNFDKTPWIEGVLKGIKGQYLILSTGVINLRKFSGYELFVKVGSA